MSPSLRESIRVGLFPDRAVFARYGRGLRPRLVEKGILPIEAEISEEPWRAVLAVLQKFLQTHAQRRADAVIVLSNHFVRYMLLNTNDSLSTREEWLAYAAHHFEKTYGARALEWDIQVAEARAGQPRLASAIDKALLEAIVAAFGNGTARAGLVLPYLMTAFNQVLPAIPHSSFWFVTQEPGRLLLGLVRDGAWQSIRGRQVSGRWREELTQMLERESALLGFEEPCQEVVVSALDPGELKTTNGYQLMAPPLPFAGEERVYATVCA